MHRVSIVPRDPFHGVEPELEETVFEQLKADGIIQEGPDGFASGDHLRLLLHDRDAPVGRVVTGVAQGRKVFGGERSADTPGALLFRIRAYPKPEPLIGRNTFEIRTRCRHVTSFEKISEALPEVCKPGGTIDCPDCGRALAARDLDFGNAGALARFEMTFHGPFSYSLLVRRPYMDKIGSILRTKVKWIHLED